VVNYRPSPNKTTAKSRAIQQLKSLSREELSNLIEERIEYLNSKIRVLETHFVASTGVAERAIATPRKDEFHVVAVDIFLKYHKHTFLFANPRNLESSAQNANHLCQNYIMGFVFVVNNQEEIHISDEWEQDFMAVYQTLSEDDAVSSSEMQVDHRYKRGDKDG